MPAWWVVGLLAVAFSVVKYLLTARPKREKPPEVQDLEDPTAEAGRPVPVVFGTVTVKGLNILWYGNKGKVTEKIDAD